jgi:hypothetical protein
MCAPFGWCGLAARMPPIGGDAGSLAQVRLLPRRPGSDSGTDPASSTVESGATGPDGGRPETKGRPTPKRRDSGPRRGPVSPAPKTRREAMARQREQAKLAKTAPRGGRTSTLGPQERRARQLAGDPAFLARRDQGPMRAFTRDYVDSRRMFSNYLLLLFPIAILSQLKSFFVTVEIALVLLVLLEGVFTGRRVMAMGRERGIERGRDKATSIGLYAIMRSYFPRRWRIPRPRVAIGDKI